MAFLEICKAQGIAMDAKATDKGVHGIDLRMPEKADPQFEIGAVAARRLGAGAGLFPQRAAPVSGFLLNVAIGSGQKSEAGPVGKVVDADGHALIIEPGGATSDPFDVGRHIAKDAANDEEPAGVKLIRGADPTHDFARSTGETFVESVVHAIVRFADPSGNLALIPLDNVERPIGRAAVDDEIF